MKHWIRKFISCILTIAIFMSAIVLPVGAYDFSMNEVIHQYNPHAFTRKNTPAVKWNGKTELKENSYYYTTSAVTISRDVILPENSTLEIRKTLKITNGAKLTVLGDLLVDYDAKVNPVNGTLTVGKSGYIHDYGALAISKKGRLEVYGHVYVMVPGSLSVKGSVSVSADGRAVYAGSFKKYPGAKVNGNITAAVNVTDQLSEELSEFSENEKICVNFLFYDSETARNTTVDGKNILEISLEIQEKYAIPAVISHMLFDDEGGSYKEYKDLSDKRTDVFLRYLKTNFGGSKGYRRYLSNDYFSNIIPNPAFENNSAENPSDNKYIVSDDYRTTTTTSSKVLLSSFRVICRRVFAETVTTCVSIPIKEISSCSPCSASTEKLPSISVIAPRPGAPFTNTEAPGSGEPVTSRTQPVIFCFCCSTCTTPADAAL